MKNKEIEKAINSMKAFACTDSLSCVTAKEMKLILEYIKELENKVKELGKGQHTLMQSRRKWKNRYYKERGENNDKSNR